jgi:hypothetical protein
VSPQQGRVEYKEIPITINRNIDILFVVDDSPSMRDKQQNLKDNFRRFIDVLDTVQGGRPDVQIGVVSSDVGTKGSRDAAPGPAIGTIGNGGCSGNGKSGNLQLGRAGTEVTGNFLRDVKGPTMRMQNYGPNDLATTFGKLAEIGDGGCGFEQHLEAMKRALSGNPVNTGFLRDDAFLAVIFIADEDDCSFARSSILTSDTDQLGQRQSFRCNRFGHTCRIGGRTQQEMNAIGVKGQCGPNESSEYLESVKTYVDFLKGLKSDPSKVIVAGVLGAIEPYRVELRKPTPDQPLQPLVAHSCSYQGANGPEVADPPTRLKFFLDQFPTRNTFTSICQRDLSGGLELIGRLLKFALGDPCIDGKLADVDPATPGAQYECAVSDVTNARKPSQTEAVVPPCNTADGANASNKPCWAIESDVLNCQRSPNNHTLKIYRSAAPAPDTTVFANCVTEAI